MATTRRREPSALTGACFGLVLTVALTALLLPVEVRVTRATPALALVLPVVVAGIVGGRAAALITALGAAAALNLAFIPPHWTFKITNLDDVVAFGVFVVVALAMGT